ncbi:MAG: hypothetical protein NXI10_14615 [bacterium]|nr:hypothetical protein [bacterium]
MALKDRDTLKNLFKKGNLPSENSFADVIDSTINKIDDGFSKSMKDGLMLSPVGKSKKVLSIFNKVTDSEAQWSMETEDGAGLGQNEKQLHFKTGENDTKLFTLSDQQRIGISNANPQHSLDVNGTIAARARIGNRSDNNLAPADGEWHTIVSGLNYCNMFEVVARTGIINSGKHAMLHAIAMSSYGNSSARVKHTYVRFSWWRPLRIKLRWTGETYNYSLQIRTTKNLGAETKIKYFVTELWSDSNIGHPEHFQKPNEE